MNPAIISTTAKDLEDHWKITVDDEGKPFHSIKPSQVLYILKEVHVSLFKFRIMRHLHECKYNKVQEQEGQIRIC